MQENFTILIHLFAALAIGILIGIERGWSGRAEDEGDRVAGLRTFSLIGLLGGVWAQLSIVLDTWMLAVAFLAVVAMIITSHILGAQKTKDVGVTTEFAMMLTFSLSALAAFGYYIYAFSATAMVVALLGVKPILHKMISNISTEEIYSGIKLLIISLVLLPMLPDKGYGPWNALNPHWIWWMVVLISGLSFIGYFLIKYAGNKVGTLLTAITGGLASSTAVTLSMAQLGKQRKNTLIFMGGVVFASSIMFIRVMIEVAIVNLAVLEHLWIPLSVMFAGHIGGGVWLWFFDNNSEPESDSASNSEIEIKNPLKLSTALQFGALLAVILLLSAATEAWFGNEGIFLLATVSGLVDVDAITLSLSRLATEGLDIIIATLGITIATAVNTLVKGFLFSFFVGFKKSLPLIAILTISVIAGLSFALLFV